MEISEIYGKVMDDGSCFGAHTVGLAWQQTSDPSSVIALMTTVSYAFGCSMELVVNSEYGETAINLIIRCNGRDQQVMQDMALQIVNVIQIKCKDMGVIAVPRSVIQNADYCARLSERRHVMLGIPTERQRGIRDCYAPGGFDTVENIDLKGIVEYIQSTSDCGLSIQIIPTGFFPDERQIIRDMIDWLDRLPQTRDVLKAKSVCQMYGAMSQSPSCLMIPSIWGQGEGLESLTKYMQSRGLDFLAAPICDSDYLLFGQMVYANEAIRLGHILPEGVPLPNGMERLNIMTDRMTLGRLFGFKAVPDISGSPKNEPKPPIPGSMQVLENMIPWQELVKHAVIAGMPGSGKTSLMFGLIHMFKQKKLPFLVIEPTKTEYRALLDAIPDLKVYTPGRTELQPMMFNPFLPPKGITLEQFLPTVETAFLTAFSMKAPLDVILGEVLHNCYARYGWRMDSTCEDADVTIFGMHEFICAYREEIVKSNYDKESKQNLLSGGVYRFQSLLNDNAYLFDTDRSVDIYELLNKHTVIELDAIDNAELKSLVLTMLLLQIKLVIRKTQSKDSELKNVILLDEAHVLLGESAGPMVKGEANPVGRLQSMLLDMVKVNRAYGTGMIFADQSLSIMRPFFENSGTKMIMRLESAADKQLVASSLYHGEDIAPHLSELQLGDFYLCGEKMPEPKILHAPDTKAVLKITSDMTDEALMHRVFPEHPKPFGACSCKRRCNLEVRKEAEYIARKIYMKMGKSIQTSGGIKLYLTKDLDKDLDELTADLDNENKLKKCAKMMTMRLISQKGDLE